MQAPGCMRTEWHTNVFVEQKKSNCRVYADNWIFTFGMATYILDSAFITLLSSRGNLTEEIMLLLRIAISQL